MLLVVMLKRKKKRAMRDGHGRILVTYIKGNTAKLVDTSTVEMVGPHLPAVEPNGLCL
jgi:hypothetical protein